MKIVESKLLVINQIQYKVILDPKPNILKKIYYWLANKKILSVFYEINRTRFALFDVTYRNKEGIFFCKITILHDDTFKILSNVKIPCELYLVPLGLLWKKGEEEPFPISGDIGFDEL